MSNNIWLHSKKLPLIFGIVIFLIIVYATTIPIQYTDDYELLGLIFQVTATIFSIIMALSIISLEHSANNHTSTILRLYIRDKFVLLVLFQNFLIMIFTLITIYYVLNYSFLILLLFIWNLFTLMIYLFYMLHMIDPMFIIKKIELNIMSEFNRKIRKNMSNDQRIANVLISDELLSSVLKYESVLENILYNSHNKRDHELTNECLKIYSNIIIHCTNYDEINESPPNSFMTYLTRKYEQYVTYNINNYDLVSINQIIETSKSICICLSNKKYTHIATSILYGIPLFITELAKNSLTKNKIFTSFQIINSFGDIGVQSKKSNTGFLISNIYEISQNNFISIELSNHMIKNILRILNTMTKIKTYMNYKHDFQILNSIVNQIPSKYKDEIFYITHFNSYNPNLLLLQYIDNNIIIYKNKKISLHASIRNLSYMVKFLMCNLPPTYNEFTINMIHNLMNEIKNKLMVDEKTKRDFSPIIDMFEPTFTEFGDIVRQYEHERDQSQLDSLENILEQYNQSQLDELGAQPDENIETNE